MIYTAVVKAAILQARLVLYVAQVNIFFQGHALMLAKDIILLIMIIIDINALLGIMEARQQTVLSHATANALQGIIVLLEALLQLAQDNALPDIIALPGLAAQRRMYVEQGITALLEVQE